MISLVRRLLRILLNAATVLSLMLSTATAAIWIRSHRICDNFTRRDSVRPSGVRIHDVCSKDGIFVWAMESRRIGSHAETARGGVWQWEHFSYDRQLIGPSPASRLLWKPTWWQQVGFIYHRGYQVEMAETGNTPFVPDFVVGLPYWAMTLFLVIPPALQLVSAIVHRRAVARLKHGLCPSCGYDLRATPDRCPECGSFTVA
jgi:hypothetical protein